MCGDERLKRAASPGVEMHYMAYANMSSLVIAFSVSASLRYDDGIGEPYSRRQ
jgi:hypothetical protein